MILYLIIFILLLIAIEIIRELNSFKITKYDISSKHKLNTRILFISDLHSKVYGKDNSRLINAVKKAEPDIILIGGDIITSSQENLFNESLSFLEEIKNIAPCYYGFGNHEVRLFNKIKEKKSFSDYFNSLLDMNINILDNSGILLSGNNSNIFIYGLTIPIEYYSRFNRRNIEPSLLNAAVHKKNKTYHDISILLAHDPSGHEAYKETGYDLILSGHYHGGVVRFGKRGFVSPQFRFFDKYSYGLKSFDNGNNMIISGGIGAHTIPIRFLNPAEINIIDL